MDEQKENENDVNYIKKNLCPKALCSNHEKNYCKAHKKLYCSYYFCYGCLSDLKKPQFKRNKGNEFNIRI